MKQFLFLTILFSVSSFAKAMDATTTQQLIEVLYVETIDANAMENQIKNGPAADMDQSPVQTQLQLGLHLHDIDMIKNALRDGADPNQIDSLERTALHWAAAFRPENNAIVVIGPLLEKGANPNIHDKGTTPLHEAAYMNYYNVAHLLIKNGADIHVEDEYGRKPCDIARSKHGEDSTIYKLLTRSLIKGISI